jgi:hypothetical protein
VSFYRIAIKKAPLTLRWWSFLEKPYVGIADDQGNSTAQVAGILP